MTAEEVHFFNNIAPVWDSQEVRSTPDRVRWLLNIMPIYSGDNVLDLGTGTGVLIPYLKEIIGDEGKITAVDFADGMLDIARQKYGELDGVTFLKSDFENESLPGRYEVVMLYCVFPHLHTPITTIKRLLNENVSDDGCIIVAFPADESFIDHIHGQREIDSASLPSATRLTEIFKNQGLDARCFAATADAYVVVVYKQ